MNETEPLYFTKFRENLETHEPKYFKEFRENMETHEPKYFKEFRENIETHEPKYFKEFREHVDGKFKEIKEGLDESTKLIDDLALITLNQYISLDNKIDRIEDSLSDEISEIRREMVTKKDIEPILKHIGLYEMRAKNVEEILLQDHKPRIATLEKEVFAI